MFHQGTFNAFVAGLLTPGLITLALQGHAWRALFTAMLILGNLYFTLRRK